MTRENLRIITDCGNIIHASPDTLTINGHDYSSELKKNLALVTQEEYGRATITISFEGEVI